MPKHNKKVVLDDNALRAFYKACGLSPKTIEGAIKTRYEEPTNFIAREKSGAAVKPRMSASEIPPKMRGPIKRRGVACLDCQALRSAASQ
jgi:hypothetical protein